MKTGVGLSMPVNRRDGAGAGLVGGVVVPVGICAFIDVEARICPVACQLDNWIVWFVHMDNINHLSPDSLGALRLPGSPAIAPSRGSSPASDLERDALPPAAAGSGTLAVVQEIRDGRYLHRLQPLAASAGDPVTIDSRPEDQGDDLAPTWSPLRTAVRLHLEPRRSPRTAPLRGRLRALSDR